MARSPLNKRQARRDRLKKAGLIVLFVFAFPTMALSAYPVFDSTANVNFIKQLNQFKKQFSVLTDQLKVLNEARDIAEDTANQIGDALSITLPFVDLAQLMNGTQKSAQCLIPNLSGIIPGIRWDEWEFGDICEGRNRYNQALLADRRKMENMTAEERGKYLIQVAKRRQEILADAVTGGMAQADMVFEDSKKVVSDLKKLRLKLTPKSSVQDKLALIARIKMLEVQVSNDQNQILAQQLKVQSLTAMAIGLPRDAVLWMEDSQ